MCIAMHSSMSWPQDILVLVCKESFRCQNYVSKTHGTSFHGDLQLYFVEFKPINDCLSQIEKPVECNQFAAQLVRKFYFRNLVSNVMSGIASSELYKLTEQVSSHQRQLRSECKLILPAVNTDNGKKNVLLIMPLNVYKRTNKITTVSPLRSKSAFIYIHFIHCIEYFAVLFLVCLFLFFTIS